MMKRVSLTSLKQAALCGAAFLFAFSASATDAVMLKRVDVTPHKGSTDFVLHTDSAPTFQSFSRKNPHMLIVDLVDAQSAINAVKNPGGVVEDVSIKQHAGHGGAKVARLTVKFKREVRYQVDAEADQVRVRIFDDAQKGKMAKRGAAKAQDDTRMNLAVAGEMGRATDDGSGGGSGAKMTFVGFKNTASESRVFARMSEKNAKYEVKKEGPNIVVLEIQGTIPLRNNKNHLDARFFESPVKVITPSEVDGATPTIRITIEMTEDGKGAPYEARREGREIAIYFKK